MTIRLGITQRHTYRIEISWRMGRRRRVRSIIVKNTKKRMRKLVNHCLAAIHLEFSRQIRRRAQESRPTRREPWPKSRADIRASPATRRFNFSSIEAFLGWRLLGKLRKVSIRFQASLRRAYGAGCKGIDRGAALRSRTVFEGRAGNISRIFQTWDLGVIEERQDLWTARGRDFSWGREARSKRVRGVEKDSMECSVRYRKGVQEGRIAVKVR